MIGIRDLISLLSLVFILTSSIIRSKPNYRALAVFGFLLGFMRRLLPSDSLIASTGINLDPLLLVIPLTFVFFVFISDLKVTEQRELDSSLKGLIVISTLSIFNPRQGSILVGLTGWVAYVIPIMFIYLGACISEHEFEKILNILKKLGIGVCIYGFSQILFGYNFWDRRWFNSVTLNGEYSVLAFGINRPFGTFSSVGEYAQAIGLSCGVVTYQYINSKIKLKKFTFYIIFFLISVALTASRAALITTFITILSPLILKSSKFKTSKSIMSRFIVVASFSIWVIPWIVSSIPTKFLGSSASLIERQSAGLGGNSSGVTPAFVHLTQTSEAFRESVKSVFGYGIGAISGAQRLNGLTRMNFESDIGNAAYAFGVFGLIAMLAVFYGLYSLIANKSFAQSSLVILLLLPSVNNWFNPGHYSTVWIMWLLVGYQAKQNTLVNNEKK